MKSGRTVGALLAIGAGLVTARLGSGGAPAASATVSPGTVAGSRVPAASGTVGTGCGQVPASGAGSLSSMAPASVAAFAARTPMLSELSRAVRAAGLTSTLNSATPITVFAPDNAAFAALGTGNVATLLANKADLAKVLKYHMVRGRITPAELASGKPLTSLLGLKIQPSISAGGYQINNADVVCGNIKTSNATVYILDKVLIPLTG